MQKDINQLELTLKQKSSNTKQQVIDNNDEIISNQINVYKNLADSITRRITGVTLLKNEYKKRYYNS